MTWNKCPNFVLWFFVLFLKTTLAQISTPSSNTTNAGSAPGEPPTDCSTTIPYPFSISNEQVSGHKLERSVNSLSTDSSSHFASPLTNQRREALVITLGEGMMVDGMGRTAGIRADGALIFQENTTTDLLYRRPFSICNNKSVALGATADWIQCLNGSITNLYYFVLSEQPICDPVDIVAIFHAATPTSTGSSTSLSVSSTSIMSSSSTGTTDTVPPSPTAPRANKSSSHTGGIVGGVVGGVGGFAFLTGAIAFSLFRRRKQQQQQQQQHQASIQPQRNEMGPNLLQVRELHTSRPLIEVPDANTSRFGELYSGRPPLELHNAHTSELYGSNVPELILIPQTNGCFQYTMCTAYCFDLQVHRFKDT